MAQACLTTSNSGFNLKSKKAIVLMAFLLS
ncbi:hypothetical protein D046_2777A, partial [Vibrio parahaemolyticus V-223/04]